jgi:hypothetical protein
MDLNKVLLVVINMLIILSVVCMPMVLGNVGGVEVLRVVVGLKVNDINIVTKECLLRRVVSTISEVNAVIVEVPKYMVEKLRSIPLVKYVEEDKEVRVLGEIQWNIEMINATDVWSTYNASYGDVAYGYSVSIRIAILDTGIDYRHRDLQGVVEYCFVSLNNGKTSIEVQI